MAMSNPVCYFYSDLPEVACSGSFISLIDLRKSVERCPCSINSDLEYLLLLAGRFSVPSDNLHRLHICSSHYHKLLKVQSKKCCELCKVLRSKSTFCRSLSSLRQLSKPLAVALWHTRQLSFYQHWICTDCRHFIEQEYVTDETIKLTDQVYERLYDDFNDLVLLPEASPMSSPCSEFHPSFDDAPSSEISDMTLAFKRLLREQHFNHRIETTNSYQNMNNKSQRTFRNQTKKILLHVTKLLSSSDYNNVWNGIVIDESGKNDSNDNRQFDIAMQAFVDAYGNAEHWSTRRQILSIISADFPKQVLKRYFPNISKWKARSARSHARFKGRGVPVNTVRDPTIRYDIKQLEHFIDFFLSPHITSDLPFGEKKVRLSTGEILLVPNTIRNSISTKIIGQYHSYCQETYFEPLGNSVLYDILKHCSASTRKSLSGLDTYSANGSSAFTALMDLCDTLATYRAPSHDIAQLKAALHQSRNYLKLDYKLHIARFSRIADHCATHGLSDPNENKWAENCDHQHDQYCTNCTILLDALNQVRSLVKRTSTIPNNLRSRFLYKVKFNTDLILKWKKHQLRTVHQNKAREYSLEQLDKESIFVYADWSMKFIPLKYREKMTDWFAKRGLSWHVTYVVRLQKSSSNSTSSTNRLYEHRSFIHVFNNCAQNGRAVVAILADVFKRLKREDPQIRKAFLRSDNAGCFHGTTTLLSIPTLFEETGVLIVRFDFSEAQAGKSECDRQSATVKGTVRRSVNEGNDCETILQFVQAAKATLFTTIIAGSLTSYNIPEQGIKWSGIKKFNNILYGIKNNSRNYRHSTTTNTTLQATVWRAFGIGVGIQYDLQQKVVNIDPIEIVAEHVDNGWKFDGLPCHRKGNSRTARTCNNESNNTLSNESSDTSSNESSNTSSNESEDIPSDEFEDRQSNDDFIIDGHTKNHTDMKSNSSSSIGNRQTDFNTFFCDEPGCIKQFVRFQNLVNHHARGDHVFKPDKLRLRDTAIQLFKSGLEHVKPHQAYQLHNFKIVSNTSTRSSDEQSTSSSDEQSASSSDEQSTSSSDEQSTSDDETETITYELPQGWALVEPNNNKRFSFEQINFLNEKFEEGKNNGSKWDANAVFQEMQNIQDEDCTFIFNPSQFLTTSQIKSYFSRLARAQRLHGSQSQPYIAVTNNTYDEEETEEIENDFNSMLVDRQEQSIRITAEDRFLKSQKRRSK